MAGKNFNFKHADPAKTKTDSVVETIIEKSNIPAPGANAAPTIKPKAEPRNRRVQLLLTESNYVKLKEYASNCGTSVNDVVNQIIENL